MAPNTGLVKKTDIRHPEADPGKSNVSDLAAPGREYAIYVNGGFQAELLLELPPGSYQAKWINTRNGRIEKTESFVQTTATRLLRSPDYTEDIALRIIAVP